MSRTSGGAQKRGHEGMGNNGTTGARNPRMRNHEGKKIFAIRLLGMGDAEYHEWKGKVDLTTTRGGL